MFRKIHKAILSAILLFAGLTYSQGSDWIIYDPSNSDLPDDRILKIAVDANGNKWLAMAFLGVSVFDGAGFNNYGTGNSGLPSNAVYNAVIEANGTKWFGTLGGLVSFDNTTWT